MIMSWQASQHLRWHFLDLISGSILTQLAGNRIKRGQEKEHLITYSSCEDYLLLRSPLVHFTQARWEPQQ